VTTVYDLLFGDSNSTAAAAAHRQPQLDKPALRTQAAGVGSYILDATASTAAAAEPAAVMPQREAVAIAAVGDAAARLVVEMACVAYGFGVVYVTGYEEAVETSNHVRVRAVFCGSGVVEKFAGDARFQYVVECRNTTSTTAASAGSSSNTVMLEDLYKFRSSGFVN
ncbi:hypothetical protein HK405_013560, partial [Cladochytrium tenue]